MCKTPTVIISGISGRSFGAPDFAFEGTLA